MLLCPPPSEAPCNVTGHGARAKLEQLLIFLLINTIPELSDITTTLPSSSSVSAAQCPATKVMVYKKPIKLPWLVLVLVVVPGGDTGHVIKLAEV